MYRMANPPSLGECRVAKMPRAATMRALADILADTLANNERFRGMLAPVNAAVPKLRTG